MKRFQGKRGIFPILIIAMEHLGYGVFGLVGSLILYLSGFLTDNKSFHTKYIEADRAYIYILVAEIAISGLLTIENVVEAVAWSLSSTGFISFSKMLSLALMNMTMLIASSSIFFYILSDGNYKFYIGICCGRWFLISSSTLSLATAYSAHNWRPKELFFSLFTGLAGSIVLTTHSSFSLPGYLCMFLSVIFIALSYIKWIWFLPHDHSSNDYILLESKTTFVIIFYLSAMICLWVTFPCMGGDISHLDSNKIIETKYLITTEIIYLVYVVVLWLLESQLKRKEISHSKEELESKRMFIRYISHEVRTPLNTAIIGLQVLLEEIDTRRHTKLMNDHRDTISDIQISCNIAVNVLNELLTFDKLEAGTLMIEKQETDAIGLIEETVHPFFIQARQKNIEIIVRHLCEDSDRLLHTVINVDRNKIAQVIRNLVSNALKFTPQHGSVEINLDLVSSDHGEEDRDEKMLKIDVVDNGAGISPSNQKKLFKEIVQFHPGKLQGGGGSGLGLYISYGIVKLHGGMLSAYSMGEGFGSTFSLVLPIANVSFHEMRRPSSTVSVAVLQDETALHPARRGFRAISTKSALPNLHTNNAFHQGAVYINNERDSSTNLADFKAFETDNEIPTSNLPRDIDSQILNAPQSSPVLLSMKAIHTTLHELKVLVVDDTAMSRKMQLRLLRTRFGDCEEAEEGKEAIEKVMAAEKPFDLVLMDSMMPVMDGLEATKRLRDFGFKGIIVGVTGNVTAEDIEMFMSRGADAVLPKPLDIHNLEVAVKSLMGELH